MIGFLRSGRDSEMMATSSVDPPVEMRGLEIFHASCGALLRCGCGSPVRRDVRSWRRPRRRRNRPAARRPIVRGFSPSRRIATAPFGVSRTMKERRSSAGALRSTSFSVDQPIDDAGDIAVRHHQHARQFRHGHAVARLRASAAMTSNCGSVISNVMRSRSRNSASIARDVRNSLHPQPKPLLAGRLSAPVCGADGSTAVISRLRKPKWPGR